MKKISEPIVFFGSGPVAARSLEILSNDFDIEAVITKPQPPHHRGDFPVLTLAEKLGLKTLTVANKQALLNLFGTKPVKSRLAILIDFGIIVPREVIDYFPLGIINSHFSILPEWRGADPITFAILSGQKQTGVSIMLLVEALDEGPLLGYGEYDMPADITAPELTNHLINLSHALLVHDVPRYVGGESQGVPQEITKRKVSYSRKLTKADGVIDWSKPAEQLEREVRAFAEWPKSRTSLAGKDVIITRAHAVPSQPPDGKPGDVDIIKETSTIMVCTCNGTLCIDRLKPAGKREMSCKEFIAGYSRLL